MNNWFKQNSIHLAITGIFLAITFFYFTPAFNGKTLGQSDVVGAQSTQKEINDYRAKGVTILWTNQIFGGMPAYQIWAPYPDNITTWVVKAVKATFPNPVDTVLIFLLGAYLLFCVLKINPWLAAAGAIAFTFSSYNIIMLVAGHSNQAFAVAFFAPILAGIILTLRGKYFTGGALTALFLAMEIRANHIQMTYYLLLALMILLGIELYHAFRKKTLPAFVKSVAYLGAALLLALLVNASTLWSTGEYSKDSYRGPSNLTRAASEPKNGLARDYAYQWSQGVGECFTFLIPNAYGGPSGLDAIDIPNSEMIKVFTAKGIPEDQAGGFLQQLERYGLNAYWGNKPGTSGPLYFGAVICFLFIFGLIVVKNRLKWWIAATVLLTVFLSFGKNLPFLSDIFFNYFPLYNKFRTVESILAVATLCFPVLAFMAVQELINTPDKTAIFKKLKIAFYIVGGLLVLMIALPDAILNYRGDDYATLVGTLGQIFKSIPTFANDSAELANGLAKALVSDRMAIERADAIRALIFVAFAFGILWAFIKQKISVTLICASLLALVLVDMWQVDKRYLKDASFQDKVDAAALVQPTQIDQVIMRDPDPDFRVFDETQGIKSDTRSPFFHKSVGGYSAARLKRFDELIDNQFTKSINHDVLDMLNTKYILVPDEKNQSMSMQANPTACGNAWFVKKTTFTKDADQEMQAISAFAPKDEAIVDQRYKPMVDDHNGLSSDATGTIKLTSYQPDTLKYETSSSSPQIAVFSEIYYDKGWKMFIDGKESPYFRADYVLRAAQIPLGNHKVEFIFHPASYYTGEKISLAGSILLVLALGGAAYSGVRKKK